MLAVAGPSVAAPLLLGPATSRVGRYEVVDLAISSTPPCADPLDTREADVALECRGPGGALLRVPAFRMQPYRFRATDPGWCYPEGKAGWHARFAPTAVGRWTCVARWSGTAGDLASAPVVVQCMPSRNRGYVRVSRRDPRWFETTDRAPFFAIGNNLAFVGPSQYLTPARAGQVLARMGAAGANWARVWTGCGDWALALEHPRSAWGRSWSGPGSVVQSGAGGVEVRVGADWLAPQPVWPVATRAGMAVEVSGTARGASGRLEWRQGQEVVGSVALTQDAAPFSIRFTPRGDWLEPLSVRLVEAKEAFVSRLALRDAATGADLMTEIDPAATGLGKVNERDAAMLDQLVSAASRSNMRLQLCLLARDLYMARLKSESSPAYSEALASACRMLRYCVARWGAYTSVGAWEYWNEQDPGLPCGRFYREAGAFLARFDAYHHLRSTSAWGPAPNDYRHNSLDFADLHWYMRPEWGPLSLDAAAAVQDRGSYLRSQAPAKPAILGEFGLADNQWGLSPDMKRDTGLLHFHDALWASAHSGLSGTAMSWWWEVLDQMDHCRHIRSLARYLAGVPFTTAGFHPAHLTVEGPNLRCSALVGTRRALLWVNDPAAAWHRVVVDGIAPATQSGGVVQLTGLGPGPYRVTWWDTLRGQPITTAVVVASNQGVRLPVPPFARDIAAQVVPAPLGTRHRP